jgi:hypothetical protein
VQVSPCRTVPLLCTIRAAHVWTLRVHGVHPTVIRCCTAVSQQSCTVQSTADMRLQREQRAVRSHHTRVCAALHLVTDLDERQCGCMSCVRRCDPAKLQKRPLCAFGCVLALAVWHPCSARRRSLLRGVSV